jgi:hypothetical protein
VPASVQESELAWVRASVWAQVPELALAQV